MVYQERLQGLWGLGCKNWGTGSCGRRLYDKCAKRVLTKIFRPSEKRGSLAKLYPLSKI